LPERLDDTPARQLPVTWTVSAHARLLLTLALSGLALAILTRRPEFAGVAAPPLLLLATRRRDRPAQVGLRVRVPPGPITEGEVVAVSAQIEGHHGYGVAFEIAPAAQVVAGPGISVPPVARPATPVPAATGLAGAGPVSWDSALVRLWYQPQRWGFRPAGTLMLALRDEARLREGTLEVELPRLECLPQPARMTAPILLNRLPSRLGEHSARTAGEGVEFAGVRAYVPGDRQRRINWPATTRHGSVYLSTFAAERTQNVVVIADTTTDIGDAGQSTLDLVLRGAAGAISAYVASRDRVGVINFGTGVSWMPPGHGRRHAARLMSVLLLHAGSAERSDIMTRLPRAALPPGALILVFSPMIGRRIVEAVRDLRERGFTVLVVDVMTQAPELGRGTISSLALRVWQLEQEATRFSLEQLGVPVVRWDGLTSLDEPLAPYVRRPMVVR
jgi:uncharacterized protein (DUF58 family)